jgi:hypothetical protein
MVKGFSIKYGYVGEQNKFVIMLKKSNKPQEIVHLPCTNDRQSEIGERIRMISKQLPLEAKTVESLTKQFLNFEALVYGKAG